MSRLELLARRLVLVWGLAAGCGEATQPAPTGTMLAGASVDATAPAYGAVTRVKDAITMVVARVDFGQLKVARGAICVAVLRE